MPAGKKKGSGEKAAAAKPAKPKSANAWLKELEPRWRLPGPLPDVSWPEAYRESARDMLRDPFALGLARDEIAAKATRRLHDAMSEHAELVETMRGFLVGAVEDVGDATSPPSAEMTEWPVSQLMAYQRKANAFAVAQAARGVVVLRASLALAGKRSDATDQLLFDIFANRSFPMSVRQGAGYALVGNAPSGGVADDTALRDAFPRFTSAAKSVLAKMTDTVDFSVEPIASTTYPLRGLAIAGALLGVPDRGVELIEQLLAAPAPHLYDSTNAALQALGFYAPELIPRLRTSLERVSGDEMRVALAKKLLAR